MVALIAAVAAGAWWSDGDDPEPRARQYRDATACLLTGAAGIDDPQAAPVWAGMQDASLATRAKVQYLEVDGPQTREQATTFLTTLTQSRCDFVLTAGAAPNAALAASAATHPNIRFVLVGDGTAQGNVSVVDVAGPDAVRTAVRDLLTDGLSAQSSD